MLLRSLVQAGASSLAPVACSLLPKLSTQLQQARGLLWSVEKEQGHTVSLHAVWLFIHVGTPGVPKGAELLMFPISFFCLCTPCCDRQYKDVDKIIDDKQISAALENNKKAAQDPVAIKAILEAAKDRSFLTNYTPGGTTTLVQALMQHRQ